MHFSLESFSDQYTLTYLAELLPSALLQLFEVRGVQPGVQINQAR